MKMLLELKGFILLKVFPLMARSHDNIKLLVSIWAQIPSLSWVHYDKSWLGPLTVILLMVNNSDQRKDY